MKRLILLILLFTACNYNRTYVNRDADRIEAEKIVHNLFTYFNQKQFDSVYSCFEEDFVESKEYENLRNYITHTPEQLGKVVDWNLDHWSTQVTIGYLPDSYYALHYLVKYEKAELKVSIFLKKIDNKIKITKYEANPDKFE